jgi:hypothetical protein
MIMAERISTQQRRIQAVARQRKMNRALVVAVGALAVISVTAWAWLFAS